MRRLELYLFRNKYVPVHPMDCDMNPFSRCGRREKPFVEYDVLLRFHFIPIHNDPHFLSLSISRFCIFPLQQSAKTCLRTNTFSLDKYTVHTHIVMKANTIKELKKKNSLFFGEISKKN